MPGMTPARDQIALGEGPSSSPALEAAVHPLDAALARWMAGREPERAEALRAAVHLLSEARRAGHTALCLADLDRDGYVSGLAEAGIAIPVALRTALEGSRLVGTPGEDAPLVLDGDLLYFRRFHDGERRIVEAVCRRMEQADSARVGETVKAAFRRLFDLETGVDWQAVAAAAAIRGRLLCIAGGPGTGKTTTVTRLMAVLLEQDPELRIDLAAPTGKAANRMAESIGEQLAELDLTPDVEERVPTTAATLHRLLGYRPTQARFTYGEDRRLEADVVIVDEASMIDHELFTSLLAALDDETRLILLGDPDQLPSVEAGFVFGDLCRAGEGGATSANEEAAKSAGEGGAKSADFVAYLADLGLETLPAVDEAAPPLRDAVVTLTRGYRFGPDSGIGRLGDALRDGRPDEALRILTAGGYGDLRLVPHDEQKRVVRRAVREFASALVGAASPSEALAALQRLRVLSPLRVGPRGVEALNEELEGWLLDEGIRPWGDTYAGKPILISTNDYDVSLFNGDVGVLWERDGRFVGCFPDGNGVREVPLLRLPPHDVSWAMTVHKAQGSEFDDVVLVLPDEADAGHLTRELLYTAVTRARSSVTMIGEADVISAAASRKEERVTGLGALLHRMVNAPRSPSPEM